MCSNKQVYLYDGKGFLWIQNENLNFSTTKNGRCIDFDAQCMTVDTHSLKDGQYTCSSSVHSENWSHSIWERDANHKWLLRKRYFQYPLPAVVCTRLFSRIGISQYNIQKIVQEFDFGIIKISTGTYKLF